MPSIAIAQPPVHLEVSSLGHAFVLAATGLTFAVLVALAVRSWMRTGTPLFLLCLVGGALGLITEPFCDVLGQIYFREKGDPLILFTILGRGQHLWGAFAYAILIGLEGYAFYLLFASRPSRTRFFKLVFALIAVNLAIEVPATRLGLYNYYGPQPFNLTGFPLYWAFTNLGGILAGAILAGFRDWFRGLRLLAVPFLMVSCFIGWELFTGWPVFAALNTDVGFALTYPAGLISIALALAALSFLARLLTAENDSFLRLEQAAENPLLDEAVAPLPVELVGQELVVGAHRRALALDAHRDPEAAPPGGGLHRPLGAVGQRQHDPDEESGGVAGNPHGRDAAGFRPVGDEPIDHGLAVGPEELHGRQVEGVENGGDGDVLDQLG